MAVRVNVHISKIMRTSIKVNVRTYATYVNCRTRNCFFLQTGKLLVQFKYKFVVFWIFIYRFLLKLTTIFIFKQNYSLFRFTCPVKFNHLHLRLTPSPENFWLVFTINNVQKSSKIIGLGIAYFGNWFLRLYFRFPSLLK